MQIFRSEQIKAIESLYINSGYSSSLELMDRASKAFVKWLITRIDKKQKIATFCGPGNNGADGLLVSIILASKGYSVELFTIGDKAKMTNEFKHQLAYAVQSNLITIEHIDDVSKFPMLDKNYIIIDALFGIGLNRPVTGLFNELICFINHQSLSVYAIDIPSGMSADSITNGICIRARSTLSFHFLKKAFLHKESEVYVGDWSVADIGIYNTHNFTSEDHVISPSIVRQLLPRRHNFAHKGDFGHVAIVGGSYGMAGAAVLAGGATLRSGAGLCTIISDEGNRIIIQGSLPAAMFSSKDQFAYNNKMTYAVGPGLGTDDKSTTLLKAVLANAERPLVIDADALNIMALYPELIKNIPKGSVLTPHPKEFARLFGPSSDTFERVRIQKQISSDLGIVIVVKDHHTTITMPDGIVYYNSTGNPGMATGGSGDVLTGMVASFMAQGLSPENSTIVSVFLHGSAADIFTANEAMSTLSPEDIIFNLSNALKKVTAYEY